MTTNNILNVPLSGSSGTGNFAGTVGPTFTAPNIGDAVAATVNKVSISAPATGSTLTIADGKHLTADNTLILAGTDGANIDFGAGGTVSYGGGGSGTLINIQAFTASGTYTPTAGVTSLQVTCIGGGGGSGGSGPSSTTGGSGGTTSFGSLCVAGGGGGSTYTTNGHGGSYNSGTGTIRLSGSAGGMGVSIKKTPLDGGTGVGGAGAPGLFGMGAGDPGVGSTAGAGGLNTGAGAGGPSFEGATIYAGAGGGGSGALSILFTTTVTSQVVTIGAGGTAGSAGVGGRAGNIGGSGFCIVHEYS
jgi:hypothetical protein